MKKLLSLLCVLAFGTAQAQYFQNLNGSPAYDELVDGTNVTLGGQGHLMLGSTQVIGGLDLVLTRTNLNGVIGAAPTFNRNYRLTTTTNIVLSTVPCKVLQIPNGRLVVVGTYYSATSVVPQGIFTAVLTQAGAVLSVRGWQTVLPAVSGTIFATSACNALPNSNTVYICGYSDATTLGNGGRPIVMAINGSTNALIWGLIHDFVPAFPASKLLANDIIASPYQPAGVAEVFIVGTQYDGNGGDAGFTYRVNAANGNPVGQATLFDSGRQDEFVAVSLATGAGGGTNGFFITGNTNVNGDWDAVAFKTDPVGSGAAWINIIDYSTGGDNFGTDVIQRLNTSNQWTYYLSGTVTAGSQGGSDMVVFFLDDNGLAQREFTYGTANSERSVEISSFSGLAAGDGITVYGNTPTSADAGQEYYVKAYYNGLSGCNEAFAIPNTNSYPLSRVQAPISRTGSVSAINLLLPVIQPPPTITPLCFNVTLAGGSNARAAENTENSVSAELYPNPVSLNSAILNLNLNSPSEQQIDIRITDMLGREVLNQTIVVAEGESLQQIQLPSGISAGVYNLSISGASVNENHRFVIE
jgi:Secretion system C-terminal sorting domain